MTHMMLWSLAAAAIFAMVAGGAAPADAAKKRNKATAGGQASSQGVGTDHAWGSHSFVYPTTKGGMKANKPGKKDFAAPADTAKPSRDPNAHKWIMIQSMQTGSKPKPKPKGLRGRPGS